MIKLTILVSKVLRRQQLALSLALTAVPLWPVTWQIKNKALRIMFAVLAQQGVTFTRKMCHRPPNAEH